VSDKKRRTVSLDAQNHDWLSDHDNASALVNDLVEQYRRNGDRGTAGLELQKKQKEREKEHLEQRLENIETDIEELDALIREYQRSEDAELAEARETLADTPRDPENPAIQSWAKDLGMTPEELIEDLEQHTS
jgi:predicted phage gp36 major capsid-like protein